MRSFFTALAVLLLLAAQAATALAQTAVTGTVRDADTGEPLPGASVVVAGTTRGTTTAGDGTFRLDLDFRGGEPVAALVFSYVGYEARTVAVDAATGVLDVRLSPQWLDLEPVVVSASRREERRSEAPVAVAVLSAAELRAARPNLLHEALNVMPGVHVTSLGNEQHTMSIRQPLSYKALFAYLEDGIPIRPAGVFNHNALIEVNMAGVDRIEVVRGPSSALFGPNAVGGAVNFVTPRPSTVPVGAVSVRTDDHGYRRGDFEASATAGRLGVWAGGYVARQREGWSEHSDFDKHSVTLRADYAFAPGTRLVTTFSANRLVTDTNGSLDSLSFYERRFASLQTFTYRRVEAGRLTGRLEHVWDRRHSSEVVVYGRRNAIGQLPHYRIRFDRSRPAQASGEENEDRFWSAGFDVRHHAYFDWRQARLTAGVSVDRSPNTFDARYLDVERDADTGRYVGYTLRDSMLTDYDVLLVGSAAYVQFEMVPVARLKVVGSLRYDRVAYDYDNHLPPSAFSGAPDERSTFVRASPRLGLTYDLGGGNGVYANFSRGFLPPEIGELYRGVKVPVLRPSTFDSYEAGGFFQFNGRVRGDFSVYRMDGTDEVIAVRLEDGSQENRNAGRTRHAGVEYGVTFAPARGLNVRFGGANARHTFVRYEDQGQRLDGNAMDAAPGWMANAEVLYEPPALPGTRFGLGWEHVGPYYMDPQNTLRYGGYDLLTLRLGYAFRGVDVWMNVQNAADIHYATIAAKSRFGQQYNPGAPRSVSFGVGYRIGGR